VLGLTVSYLRDVSAKDGCATVMNSEHFFLTARERERIRRKRLAGEPRPWTLDPIFNQYRFTNVHREHDKTTIWFRENIREPLCANWREGVDADERVRLVEATIIFRWFNLISTGEIIKDLLTDDGWDTEEARRRLKDKRPVVTGAFMVHSPIGYNKLDGLLAAIDWARPKLPAMVARWGLSQEEAHRDLRTLDNMGSFSAGEVIWDLRWTPILDKAHDINTWVNAGPGCARGLGYILDNNPAMYNYGSKYHQIEMLALMRQLLDASRLEENWPHEWDPWELHEVEMWLCEYAKYRSAMVGGQLKRRF